MSVKMAILLAFILILNVFASDKKAAEQTSSGGCMSKNPFLRSLSEQSPINIEILDTVMRSSKFTRCKSEWRKHGSCCSTGDLLAAFSLESDLINSNIK